LDRLPDKIAARDEKEIPTQRRKPRARMRPQVPGRGALEAAHCSHPSGLLR
jgi:hypothetical protein